MTREEFTLTRKEFSYSIWMIPEGETYDKFKSVTDSLSRKYDSPLINPHVTLVGGFSGDLEEFLYAAERLAAETRPFTVRLQNVEYLDEFFRSLFIRAEKNCKLLNAYKAGCDAYETLGQLHDPENYLPHMSLLYRNFDSRTKDGIITDFGTLPKEFEVRRLHAVVNNERDKIWPELAQFELK